MNQGIQILINRIESHPHEFAGEDTVSKWAYLISFVFTKDSAFDEEEQKALRDALRNMRREQFTQQVLKQLTVGDDLDSELQGVAERFARKLSRNPLF